jgi:hypothetical protein
MLEDVAPVSSTKPATRPSDTTLSYAAPSTQPVATAVTPTTQPLLAEVPSTQPATVAEAVDEELMQGYAEEVEGDFAAAPATQPAHETTVVELEVEEVTPEDANK